MGQGAATAIHPKAEEHPQAYQPATQPREPLRPEKTLTEPREKAMLLELKNQANQN